MPSEAAASATGWIAEVLEALDREADENTKAAEEEELAGEAGELKG